MKISYQSKAGQEEVTEEILVNGRAIGEMIDRQDRKIGPHFHAVIRVQFGPHKFIAGLAQGHGATKEEAITKAFICGCRNAEDFLVELAHIAKEMAIDGGAAQ